MQPLPISVRKLWQAAAVVSALLLLVGLLALDFFLPRLDDEVSLPGPTGLLAALVAIPVGLIGFWLASARWASWGYEITDKWISAQWGIFNKRVATVPRNRVQTVTTNDGPIDRMLNLSTLNVHTAGAASPNLHIPHLEDETVSFLRKELGQGVNA